MQFYLFNICPKLHRRKLRKYASHSSELSQLHQQPVDAVVRPTFVCKLCYKLLSLHSDRRLIEILTSLLNGAMLTGRVMRNFQNVCNFWRPI